MASSRSKALHQGRSLSFPSESRPSPPSFNDHLWTVRSSEATVSSMSSINENLKTLQHLYINIDDFLLSSYTSSKGCHVNQILDGYIRLLDSCNSVKDLVSQKKHELQELSSAIRRMDTNANNNHLTYKRRTKKMIEKSLKKLKSSTVKINTLENGDDSMSIVYMLREAESVSFSVLESLLSYMMGSKSPSLVSKLLSSKKVGVKKELNEFAKTDSMLQMSQVEELIHHLKGVNSNIEVLEQELECLFRQLIKTRVSLLNILNN